MEDMRTMIQEWFSQADNLFDLAEIYYTIRDESTTQFEFMAEEIVQRVKQWIIISPICILDIRTS